MIARFVPADAAFCQISRPALITSVRLDIGRSRRYAGNSTVKARLEYMVIELKKVQEALGDGYLSVGCRPCRPCMPPRPSPRSIALHD